MKMYANLYAGGQVHCFESEEKALNAMSAHMAIRKAVPVEINWVYPRHHNDEKVTINYLPTDEKE